MVIITGAAGFIGSCLAAKFNERKIKDLILVDHLDASGAKKKNLAGKQYVTYYEKDEFIHLVEEKKLDPKVDCLIHMGACSSTTLDDAKYFDENNFQYTRKLCDWALANKVRFIYASSAATYGDGSIGYKDDIATIMRCKPLNLYGQSKQKFDAWVVDNMLLDRVVGLKYFNVFGPNEYHKEDMRSIVCKAYPRVAQEGKMSLFKSYKKEYADGEQKRDFIYIKDAVDMTLFFFDNPKVNGIFNVGTGQARSWNDVARALFAAVGKQPQIDYIDMPEGLRSKYQYFTQADMSKLRANEVSGASGYQKPCIRLEEAIRDYVPYLKADRYL